MTPYAQGYCVALVKLGLSPETLYALMTAREELPPREAPKTEPKMTGGNAPKSSKIPGAKQFGRLPGWGKAGIGAIGGAAMGAGIAHLLKKDKD